MCSAARAEARRHRQRVRAGTAVGSPLMPLASSAASRVSSNMSRSLFDAAPSVPMPTLTPSSSIFGDRRDAGAPASGCWSDCGRRRRRRSSARAFRHRPRGRSGRPAPWRRTAPASSPTAPPACRGCGATPRLRAAVSERCVWSGTSNSAASSAQARRISAVQVYGACGAGPATISGCPCQRVDEVARAGQASLRSSPRRASESAAPSARTARACRPSAVASATASSK